MALDFDKPPYDYSYKGSKAPKVRQVKSASKPAPKLEDKNILTYGQRTQAGQAFAPTPGNNWLTDRMRDWTNFIGEVVNPGRRNVIGGGYGDYLLGSNPNDKAAGVLGSYRDGSRPQRFERPVEDFQDKFTGVRSGQAQQEQTLADYLRQAMELIGSGGGGDIPSVNYDPQRNELNRRASENDARLEAMYRQLRDSIDADAPVLQQGYQQAIDATRQNATDAQAQTQAATDAANARNNEVLANLGIQQAQGNIIQQGNDLNTQTAQRIADQAVKGQAANDRLVSNQATALQHNTNIGNAAGLEGNLQRAANNARLQALLAEIGMQEQDQNAAIAAQNASRAQSGLGEQLQLAQWLMGQSTDERRYQDDLQLRAAQAAAEASAGQQALPDLGTYLQALGINPQDIAKNPDSYGSLLSALTKFGVTQ